MRLVHRIACLVCLLPMSMLMACSRSHEAGPTVGAPEGQAASEEAAPRAGEHEDAQASPPPAEPELPRSEDQRPSPVESAPPKAGGTDGGTSGSTGASGSASPPQDRPPAGPIADVREPPPPPGPKTR